MGPRCRPGGLDAFFFKAEDGIRDWSVTGVQTCALPISGIGQPYFQKEFFHNGYIKSLKQLVHFYNTRDVYPFNVTSGHCPAGTTEKVDCWPMPEIGRASCRERV